MTYRLMYLLTAAHVRAVRAVPRNDRGDVPGWVLVTVMTAGLVAALWAVAGETLERVFQNAIQGAVDSQ